MTDEELNALADRPIVKIRKSRIESGNSIGISYVVPVTIKMSGRSVTRVVDPEGDSVMEYTDKEEAEAVVIEAGYRPIY